MRKTRKTLVAMAATAALALTLTACGSDDGNSESSGDTSSAATVDSGDSGTAGEYNAQDVSFAQGMIPHHRGALEMAEEAADKASSAEVKSLAARIEKAQAPEIETMTGWLKTWGKDVPTSTESMPGMEDMDSMPGMDHGATGTEFDKNFLTMMIEHHEGAVTMATTEKAKGKYGPATSMADDVIRTQNAEITEMNKLLGKS
ncbi:DUF305 domain-containing protein [Streptomyces sp. ADMS]|uniref:DUF305 domain-containing protein n=1 Tax=Streptomyces sp. ADMS TaxID=3071415 RepID=UPI00296E4121|nr:DUF305 domain-containing protein [Streptomyces sp. ADMS]MDW4908983.1 DUF305 domain-containing protein [Streptomyces sp. ADMS]